MTTPSAASIASYVCGIAGRTWTAIAGPAIAKATIAVTAIARAAKRAIGRRLEHHDDRRRPETSRAAPPSAGAQNYAVQWLRAVAPRAVELAVEREALADRGVTSPRNRCEPASFASIQRPSTLRIAHGNRGYVKPLSSIEQKYGRGQIALAARALIVDRGRRCASCRSSTHIAKLRARNEQRQAATWGEPATSWVVGRLLDGVRANTSRCRACGNRACLTSPARSRSSSTS